MLLTGRNQKSPNLKKITKIIALVIMGKILKSMSRRPRQEIGLISTFTILLSLDSCFTKSSTLYSSKEETS